MLHHSKEKCDWGVYSQIRDEIYERYIINDNLAPKNYYFTGGLGVGKTTLLTAIARMLLKTLNINVRYITMPSLMKLITSILKEDRAELEEIKKCQFLFVDDIGQEKYNTDNQESLMRDFFVNRYGNLRPTFIAGNIDIGETKKGLFYTQLNDYMNDSKHFEVIKIEGKSRRV